jgi:hypothetical protein
LLVWFGFVWFGFVCVGLLVCLFVLFVSHGQLHERTLPVQSETGQPVTKLVNATQHDSLQHSK